MEENDRQDYIQNKTNRRHVIINGIRLRSLENSAGLHNVLKVAVTFSISQQLLNMIAIIQCIQ